MRIIQQRLYFIAILAILLFAFSCNKEDVGGINGQEGEFVNINLDFKVNAEVTVKAGEQESQFNTIHIWAYKYDGNTIPADAYPVAYLEHNIITASNTATASLQMPAALLDGKFRFMAIANPLKYGNIFKARKNYLDVEEPLTLQANITYKDLTTAVFDANKEAGAMTTYPSAADVTQMPLSHWVDVTDLKTDRNVSISLYRAIAKTEFYAKLGANSAGGLVKINDITLTSAKRYNIPTEGFVFSSLTTIDSETSSPAVFGQYSSLFVAVPEFSLKNNNSEIFSPVSITKTQAELAGSSEAVPLVASNFLYENFFGQPFAGSSFTSPDDYATGAFYMKVEYHYGINDNGDFSAGTEKTGVSYVPLPYVVRNTNYRIEATFDFNVDGNVTVSYSVVADWNDGGTTDLPFTYPTFRISATKTVPDPLDPSKRLPDYSMPVAEYNSAEPDSKGFGFNFNITGCTEWNVIITNSEDFSLSIVKNEEDPIHVTSGGIYSVNNVNVADTYVIKVYPNKVETNTIRTTDLYISYPASWLGGINDELLINSRGGGTLWSDSGGERYKIQITQPAAR